MRALPLLLVLAALAAGCAKPDEPVAANAVLPGLVVGTVSDAALTPLAGANVSVEGANQSMLADGSGAFRFTLPPGEHVLLASLAGYKVAALRANVVSDQTATLAFTLEPLPKDAPYRVAQEAKGLVGCRVLVERAGERTLVPCGAQDPNERTRADFAVDTVEELGGAVVELAWEPASQASGTMELVVSRAAGGKLVPIAASRGSGHVALPIPARLLGDLQPGDALVAEVTPAGSLTDDEAGADASVIAQQPFTLYVTLFYREEPPGGYSAMDA